MLNNHTLASPGEQLTKLDDDALAAIVGGFGIPWGKIFKPVFDAVADCIKEGLDDVIEAAGDGFADARG